ncbi:MAG: UDP-N-acetylmuramoyl-L-alanyl-D-glutamate--2,6-diaminopimelate ligase [Gemmatimonadota bacterium]
MTDRLPGGKAGISVEPELVLSRLTAAGLSGRWIGGLPAALTGFHTDSRRIEPGDLFCAIPGTVVDGHAYIPQAVDRGASACVTERETERELDDLPVPLLVTPDARRAASHLASLFAADPGRDLRLVGVTGTNGKTSTVLLLQHLLSPIGTSAALGTLGVWPEHAAAESDAGDGAASTTGMTTTGMTTPGPVELMAELERIRLRGTRLLAMEVSSHALDQRRTDALEFECAVFTNLTHEHLNYHTGMSDYRAAKLHLAALLAPGGTAVVCADEPAWRDADFGGHRVVTFGFAPEADVRALDIRTGLRGSQFRLSAHGQVTDVELPLLGAVNVVNALGAVAAALAMGLEGDLAELLASMSQIPGRMEVLALEPGLIVRDYAHTADAMARGTAAMRKLTAGRAMVLFGCGGDRDRGKRSQMGSAAAEGADLLLVTEDNPRSEDLARIIADIVSGLPEDAYEVVLDRRQAIQRGIELLGPGDSLLLAGKGHETYQIVNGEKRPFDEPAIVAEILGQNTS